MARRRRAKKPIDPNGICRLNLQVRGALMIAIQEAAERAKPKELTVSSWVRKALHEALP